MKRLSYILILLFFSCTTPKYVWMQRKAELTDRGYKPKPGAVWELLDTTKAQPLYELKRLPQKFVYGYGN